MVCETWVPQWGIVNYGNELAGTEEVLLDLQGVGLWSVELNYSGSANWSLDMLYIILNGVCVISEFGCTNPCAIDYDPYATIDDGSCGPGFAANCESPTMEGHTYDVVVVGSQCWFAENLRTSTFRNGDAIGTANPDDWGSLKRPFPSKFPRATTKTTWRRLDGFTMSLPSWTKGGCVHPDGMCHRTLNGTSWSRMWRRWDGSAKKRRP